MFMYMYMYMYMYMCYMHTCTFFRAGFSSTLLSPATITLTPPTADAADDDDDDDDVVAAVDPAPSNTRVPGVVVLLPWELWVDNLPQWPRPLLRLPVPESPALTVRSRCNTGYSRMGMGE